MLPHPPKGSLIDSASRASPDGWAVWGIVVSTRWWLLVDHCVLRNWDRILVRAVTGLIYRAGMVSICPLLWQRDVKLQQTKLGLQSGARLKPFCFGLRPPLVSRPPPLPKTPSGADFLSPQQADLVDSIAQLRNEIYALKLAPPVPPTPAMCTPLARPRPGAFTSKKVPRIDQLGPI